nr:hypothetical protein [Halorubrum sp. Atlit-26R]
MKSGGGRRDRSAGVRGPRLPARGRHGVHVVRDRRSVARLTAYK